MGRNLDTKWNVNFLVLVTQSRVKCTCYDPNMAFLLNNLYIVYGYIKTLL